MGADFGVTTHNLDPHHAGGSSIFVKDATIQSTATTVSMCCTIVD